MAARPLEASRDAPGALLLDVLLAGFAGALVAASRHYLDLHAGIPGHTGLLWMFLLVGGRGLVRRQGAGALIGVSAALWGLPMGLKHSLPYNLMLYSLPGLGLDLLLRSTGADVAHPVRGLAAGVLAHAVKFAFVLAYAVALDFPRHFFAVGVLTALGYHLLFGAAGGLAAGVALRCSMRFTPPVPGTTLGAAGRRRASRKDVP